MLKIYLYNSPQAQAIQIRVFSYFVFSKFDEEVLEEVVEEEAEEPPKTGQSGENSVRFGNSFTESQPLQTPKKNHVRYTRLL